MTDMASAPSSIAVLTSGGDAGGMNATVRAVVRTALFHGVDAHVINDGFQGLVDGGEAIRRVSSADVGGILHRGGTVFGTARCNEFRTQEGRRKAVRNLLDRRIDALVVIGGDGSLTGANLLRQEWADVVAELVEAGEVTAEVAAANPFLRLVGLVGSIDNDMSGTDMTIGTDTALHRITEALDSIRSTASSHQRTFVVEVMGRHCGYLALTAGLATAANWLLIPEHPPDGEDWAQKMCAAMRAGHEIGRRQSLVLVTEGAQSRDSEPISVERVKEVLEEQLGDETRVTILGHVQRGGAPSAFDRCLATLLGNAAVERLLADPPDATPQLIGILSNQVASSPLTDCLAQTHEVAERIAQQDYEGAMLLRGGSLHESQAILNTMQQAAPRQTAPGRRRFRLAVLHGGGPAPGMNTAVRAAVRLGLDRGYSVLAVKSGFLGLCNGDIQDMDWMSVSGWVSEGGADIGTNTYVPDGPAIAQIAKQVAEHRIDGLLMAGGWAGYQAAHLLHTNRQKYASLDIPCLLYTSDAADDLLCVGLGGRRI